MRTITIEISEGEERPYGITVREGAGYHDELTRDEALGTIACVIYTGAHQFGMRTKEEWDAWRSSLTTKGTETA